MRKLLLILLMLLFFELDVNVLLQVFSAYMRQILELTHFGSCIDIGSLIGILWKILGIHGLHGLRQVQSGLGLTVILVIGV